MSKSPGRPKKYKVDSNLEKKIIDLIREYNNNHNPHSTIKYKHIWEYSLRLYEQNLFSIKTSYDFWKRKGRPGRELVDTVNALQNKKIYISKTERIDLIDLKDLIAKYGGKNKDILWDNIEPYDQHINGFIERINKLENENIKLNKELLQNEDALRKLNETNNKLQNLLLSMFTYSNKENELANMINTGQSKSPLINMALENTFENPEAFVLELTNPTDRNQMHDSKNTKNPNVIPLQTGFNNNKPEYDL